MATEVSSSASELRERIGSLSISQGYPSSSEEGTVDMDKSLPECASEARKPEGEVAKFTAVQNSTPEFTIRTHHPTLGVIEKTFKGRFAERMARQERMRGERIKSEDSSSSSSGGRTLILPNEVPTGKLLKQRQYQERMAEILTKNVC